MDDTCVQEQYLENIGQKKGHPSGSYQKEDQRDSKERNKKLKGGKYKNTTTTTHQCKYPRNHCNHCNIDGHTKENCWKLHLELNPKKCKKDEKEKNLLAIDSINQVESSSDVDENIVYKFVQKEVNLSSLHYQ
jgi:hypothetical protein